MLTYPFSISLENVFQYILVLGIAILALILIKKLTLTILQIRAHKSLLEIIPPHNNKQSLLATEQFLTTLHALGQQRSWFEKLIGKKKVISLEIVSSKGQGIRFLVRVATKDTEIVKKHLLSFLPGARIKEISDYLPTDFKDFGKQYSRTVSLRLLQHYKHALKDQTQLTQHDPIAYIAGQMTKLSEDDLCSVQFVLQPTNSTDNSQDSFRLVTLLFKVFTFLILSPFTLLGWIIFQDNHDALPFWLFTKKNTKDKEETDVKVNKQLFKTTIRLHVSQKTKKDLTFRVNGLVSAFASFRSVNQQELLAKKQLPFVQQSPVGKLLSFIQIKYRLLALTQNPILSVREIAGLFHFPISPQTEDLVNSKSTSLPAPLSLKQKNNNLDVVFAKNTFADTTTPIGLTKDERRRHIYILGATGMGKTTLLATSIIEDIKNGKGVCVIDPHGDLISKILPNIPKERITDTILFDPDDTDFPIGLNLLTLPENVTDKELQKQKEFIASNLISIIMKLYPPRYTGPRMEYILRNAVLTALETEKPTLFTIQKLLVDSYYRKQIVTRLKNPALILFWTKEFFQMGTYQKADAVSPITNKIGKFITSSLSANILGQKEPKLDFIDILDSGKVLLCDLSKGKIGEDFSSMFGSLITASVQLAALKRARIPENERRDFYLYIDEFQNFANSSFIQIMSEARKYRLNATLAHQTIAQIEDHDLVKVILANTGSIVCFRTGGPLDEEFILPFFRPQVDKGEISNLPPYNFYMKINGDVPQNSFSGETIPNKTEPNKNIHERIKKLTRDRYAVTKDQVEQEIQKEFFALHVKKDKKIAEKPIKRVALPEDQATV
jgi:hypothetical protein